MDTAGREALCKYVLRPVVAQERITHGPDGLVRTAPKKPFADGTVAVDMDPLSHLCGLAASVPPPRLHTVRYSGVLTPASKLRARIVPKPAPAPANDTDAGAETPKRGGSRYRRWAYVTDETLFTPLERASLMAHGPRNGRATFRCVPAFFTSCPIASRFVDTREDALSYYAHRLVGRHELDVKGTVVAVWFNPEEIHLFTDERTPCPACDVLRRTGASGEVRCFSRERARRMDEILATLRNPAAALVARIRGGRTVYGPADSRAQRLAVVVAPGSDGAWFVRTVWPATARSFRDACASNARAPWPPK
jgi:hypothetical protein